MRRLYGFHDAAGAPRRLREGPGATVVEELTDLEFGHRRYTCDDPQGHQWSFAGLIGAAQ